MTAERSNRSDVLIYGATGYTGQLAAQYAVELGVRPILAGRDSVKLEWLGRRLGLKWRAFSLDDPTNLRDGLADARVVLHAAGPFSATSRPMADACMSLRIHYVDITGEIDVFESLAAHTAEAESAGITLLPGAGFDVVPSDCLAAHVARRLPGATRLRLTIAGFSAISRGTAKTMVESVSAGMRVRRGGRIVEQTKVPRLHIDLGTGASTAVGVSWGDVSTAWYSTGIDDIDVFFATTRPLAVAARLPAFVNRLIATGTAQRFLKRQIERRFPPGPTQVQRSATRHVFLAEAWDACGNRVASRLETPEAYTLTARTAVEITRRVLSGGVGIGFQTPSRAFGADFILQFQGVVRTDIA